jgi:acyl-CoA dehydrogenase
MPDTRLIRTFLDARHGSLAERAGDLAREIAARLEPADDASARKEARSLVALFGAGSWLQPIFDLDLRGCCLMREALGEASPLADAVFALQALGTTPILLAGSEAQKQRWLAPIAAGKVMTAFAMTESGAGRT